MADGAESTCPAAFPVRIECVLRLVCLEKKTPFGHHQLVLSATESHFAVSECMQVSVRINASQKDMFWHQAPSRHITPFLIANRHLFTSDRQIALVSSAGIPLRQRSPHFDIVHLYKARGIENRHSAPC